MDKVLTALVNEISTLPRPLLLVLDDYHLVEALPIHEIVAFLLDHLPPQAHVAIATRTDPPLQLSILRGRRQLTELRETDLRFTPDEAAAFLNQIAGLGLEPDDIAALEERTEGWITGLQLAALSMQGRNDISSFIEAFAGSNRYVIDYLTEEVLQRQSAQVQSFLLETSILDRMSGSLCDTVTGRGAGAATLTALDQANLFLVPLDDERRWYRYHRLFRDLLRARIGDSQPKLIPELYQRASIWHEEEGEIDDAVRYAKASGDLPHVSRLIEVHGIGLLLRGELTMLLRWMSALPEEMINLSPSICIWYAWALLLSGQLEAVEPRLQQAEKALPTTDKKDLPGHIAAIRAYLSAQMGDMERTIELSKQALGLLDTDNLGIRGVVQFVLGGTYLMRGDIAASGEAMALAAKSGIEGGNIHIAVPALNALAGIESQQGHLRRAQDTARKAIQVATGPGERLLPIAAGPLSALAELAYEWNDLKKAMNYIEQSIELGRRWGNRDSLAHGYLTLSRVLLGSGDLKGSSDFFREAELVSHQPSPPPLLQNDLRAVSMHIALAQGDLEKVRRIADETLPQPDPLRAHEKLVLARAQLVIGQPEVTLQMLAPLTDLCRKQGMMTIVIWALALQAIAYEALRTNDRAMGLLEESLSLAEPEGYIRLFIDLGPEMKSLLRKALELSISPEYTRRLLSAFESISTSPADAGRLLPTQPQIDTEALSEMVEPLSPRELEVLSLVADGLTNREIAGRLYIAESTVKSHLNTIYQKLDVKNRTQAVAHARNLNLLT
jgi:LuxR family maltose regulon positive regulatory protein